MVDTQRLIQNHKELRELAAEALFRTAVVAEVLGATVQKGDEEETSRSLLLREAAERLLDDQFTLTVVGEFSRGKSTLINALLGCEELLPTAIEPATAAITVLTGGEEAKAVVTYDDGTTKDNIPLAELPHYVLGKDLDGRETQSRVTQKVARFSRRRALEELTTADVETEAKQAAAEAAAGAEVVRVEVTYPSPFLADGIRLVDTPGLGSVNPKHGVATQDFIRESDAVLFLINTDPVIGASECNFLTFLQDYVDQFLFVVTKIDRYTLAERERSVRYTRDTIVEHAGMPDPRLYPLSAKLALDGATENDPRKLNSSGFPEFLRALDEFLIDGRGQRIMREYVGTARMHARDLRKSVELELQGIELSLEELQRRAETTHHHLDQARRTREHLMRMLDSEVDRLVDEIVMGPTHTARLRLTSIIRDDLSEQLDQCGWEELQQAAQIIPIYVHEILSEKLADQLETITEAIRKLRENMAHECYEVIHDLDQNLEFTFAEAESLTQEDFAFQLDPAHFQAGLKRIVTDTIGSTLTVALKNGYQFGGIGALVMVGGGMLARSPLTETFRVRARDQIKAVMDQPLRDLVGTILQNVRDEVARGLADYCTELGETLDRTIRALEESLHRLARDRESAAFNTAERTEELKAQLQNLDEIDEILKRARPA